MAWRGVAWPGVAMRCCTTIGKLLAVASANAVESLIVVCARGQRDGHIHNPNLASHNHPVNDSRSSSSLAKLETENAGRGSWQGAGGSRGMRRAEDCQVATQLQSCGCIITRHQSIFLPRTQWTWPPGGYIELLSMYWHLLRIYRRV